MGTHEIVVLLGGPGSGKGTQAVRLAKLLGVPHLASGDLLRDHRQRGTELGRRAQSAMDNGDLVPDELVTTMVLQRLTEADAAGGALLDGFPRDVAQAEALDCAPSTPRRCKRSTSTCRRRRWPGDCQADARVRCAMRATTSTPIRPSRKITAMAAGRHWCNALTIAPKSFATASRSTCVRPYPLLSTTPILAYYTGSMATGRLSSSAPTCNAWLFTTEFLFVAVPHQRDGHQHQHRQRHRE